MGGEEDDRVEEDGGPDGCCELQMLNRCAAAFQGGKGSSYNPDTSLGDDCSASTYG